jgi:hypothetical protein
MISSERDVEECALIKCEILDFDQLKEVLETVE